MTTKILRQIVKIDEEKCDGCGACAIACAEGALQAGGNRKRQMGHPYPL